MPRTLSTAVAAAIAAAQVSPILFAVVAFADNTYYLFGGLGTLTPAGPASNPLSTFPYGQTFTGLGWLAKLSSIPQTQKIKAQNITLALSGIPSTLVSEAVGQVRITGTATIYLGFFNSSGALLEDPVQIFYGGLDVPTLSDGGDTCTLSITCENPLLSLNLAPNRRFSDADQQIYFPGDLGFSFVDALANKLIIWPCPASNSSPYPEKFVVTPNNAAIAVGGTQTMTLTGYYSDGSTNNPNAVWSSLNPAIATANGATGVVTGVSPGICTIVAHGNNVNDWRASASIIVHS